MVLKLDLRRIRLLWPESCQWSQRSREQESLHGAIALTAPESWGWAKGATLNAGIINNNDGATDRNSGNWGSTSI